MRESPSTTFVGLDVGTSLVRCVVGVLEANNPSKLSIIGHGVAPNAGMRKGSVVLVDDVATAIGKAITEAERISGMHIEGATVNINGAHVSGLNSRGVIAISAANREITIDDRLRVEEAATIVQLPSNREIIQVFAQNYRLDGQENIKDPVGMQGVRLEVDAHIVTAATPNVRNLQASLEKAGIVAHNRTLSSLAAAEAVLPRQQKEAGTLVLDIGAGTTNLVIFEDGEVQHAAVLPIGGQNITNDLAIGLKTDLEIAEAVKVQHASVHKGQTRRDIRLKFGGKDHVFKSEDVSMIVEARVEELFELVDKELARVHKSRKLPGGVVLVGGTAKLPGIDECAKEHLQLAARIGKLQQLGGLVDTVVDPGFCTAVGLMLLDMLLMPEDLTGHGERVADKTMKLVDGLLRRFRR
jgi:cell division protein FtsA